MKKTVIFAAFAVLAAPVFSQQVLWTTIEGAEAEFIPLNKVTGEVLAFYDQYAYYYDFTGFNKDTFIATFDQGGDKWKWIYDIREKTVMAVKVYIEGGSAVYVVYVDAGGVNMVTFSNVFDTGSQETSQSRKSRSRFEKWLKSLLK